MNKLVIGLAAGAALWIGLSAPFETRASDGVEAPLVSSSVAPSETIGGTSSAALVRWRNQRFALAMAPANLPAATRATLEQVAPLAEALGYRLDVSRCGRIVCATDATVVSVQGAETVQRAALDRFDALFPGAGPGRVIVLARTRDAADAESFEALEATDVPVTADERPVTEVDGHPFRVAAWVETHASGTRRAAEGRLVRALTFELATDRYGDLPAWFSFGLGLHVEELTTGRFASVDADATERTWRVALKRKFGHEDAPRLDLVPLGVHPAPLDLEAGPGVAIGREDWALVAALAAHAGSAGLGPVANDLSRKNSPARPGDDGRHDARRQVEALEAHRGPAFLTRVEQSLALGRSKPESAATRR